MWGKMQPYSFVTWIKHPYAEHVTYPSGISSKLLIHSHIDLSVYTRSLPTSPLLNNLTLLMSKNKDLGKAAFSSRHLLFKWYRGLGAASHCINIKRHSSKKQNMLSWLIILLNDAALSIKSKQSSLSYLEKKV